MLIYAFNIKVMRGLKVRVFITLHFGNSTGHSHKLLLGYVSSTATVMKANIHGEHTCANIRSGTGDKVGRPGSVSALRELIVVWSVYNFSRDKKCIIGCQHFFLFFFLQFHIHYFF